MFVKRLYCHVCRYGLILNPKKKQAQLKPSAFGDSSDEEVLIYVQCRFVNVMLI